MCLIIPYTHTSFIIQVDVSLEWYHFPSTDWAAKGGSCWMTCQKSPCDQNGGSRTFSRASPFKLHVVGERALAHCSENGTSCHQSLWHGHVIPSSLNLSFFIDKVEIIVLLFTGPLWGQMRLFTWRNFESQDALCKLKIPFVSFFALLSYFPRCLKPYNCIKNDIWQSAIIPKSPTIFRKLPIQHICLCTWVIFYSLSASLWL